MRFELKDGSFYYPVKRSIPQKVFDNVSYNVDSGEMLAILGRNGMGKTTLLRSSMGIIKLSGGDAFIDGENIKDIPACRFWQRVAYVPQARNASVQFTVEEMVLIGRSPYLKPWQQPGDNDRKISEIAMDIVGISGLKKKNCTCLSGGELQLVLIARALAGEPEMIVLDEPESNLDFKNQLIVLETLRRLSSEKGICCVFNTHYPEHAIKYADKVLMLTGDSGCILGTAKEVITETNLRDAFGVNVYVSDVTIDGRNYSQVLPISVVA
jgi:iron complex transport system ATP-binding protein